MKKWRNLQIVVLSVIVFAFGIGIGGLEAEENELQEFPLGELSEQEIEELQASIEPQAVDTLSLQKGPEPAIVYQHRFTDGIGASEGLQVLEAEPPQELELLEEVEVFRREALVEEKVLEFDEEIGVLLGEVDQSRLKKLEILKTDSGTNIRPPQKLESTGIKPVKRIKASAGLKKLEVLEKVESFGRIKPTVQLDQADLGEIQELPNEEEKLSNDVSGGSLPVGPAPQLEIKSATESLPVRRLEE